MTSAVLTSEPTTVRRTARKCRPTPCPAIRGNLLCELQRHFKPAHVRYIVGVLNADELTVLSDIRDALIIARIKGMSPKRLCRYDNYFPINAREERIYKACQLEWIRHEYALLTLRLGRTPTQAELSSDFARHRNGLRFRAYYTMKHPHLMAPAVR
jgi:hypothetical protein